MGPGIAIEIGGQQRVLRFTHNALALLEQQGLGYRAITDAMQERPIGTLRAMVWAGLGAKATLEQVGDWLDSAPDILAVNRAAWEAYVQALPAAEGNGGPPGAAATIGTAPVALPSVPAA